MDELRKRARSVPKGNRYEDFDVGRTFVYHWGRTVNDGDNSLFTTLTLHYNPLYFNADYAAAHGHDRIVVNPLLVFNTVFGLSVEDLSEGGGPFLGVNELTYYMPVHVGDTLTARSEVIGRRESKSKPGMGIVNWRTRGFRGLEMVIEFTRTNLVRK